MAWDASATNRLLFTYGDIQCSPEEVVQLNKVVPTSFDPMLSAGYRVLLSGYALKIREQERSNGSIGVLNRALNKLRSIPHSDTAKKLKGRVDVFSVSDHFYRLDYQVGNGQVLVFNIQPIKAIQRARDKAEKPALYKVKKTQGVWKVEGKIDKADAGYAAVNGQSNNLAKAPWLMGAHLNFEFGKTVDEFTLFHNPSVGGVETLGNH